MFFFAKMGKQVIFLLAIWCMIDFVFTRNESNIQQINNRLKKVSQMTENELSFNETANKDKQVILAHVEPKGSYVTDYEYRGNDKELLVPFGRNNPELDWKKPLKIATITSTEKPKDLDVDFMIEKLQKTANSIQWLVDIYDPLRWRKVPGNLQEDCKRDMEKFLRALKDGKIWAAKLSDASGRYSSQFHFGNGYWLGSSPLCSELNSTKEENILGGLQERPPFPVKFHVARMFLQMPKQFDIKDRQVFLGLCLPETCNTDSVTSMLRASVDRVEIEGNVSHRSSGLKVLIFAVKPIPATDYNLFEDSTFFTLIGIGAVIAFLMICASIYEYGTISDVKEQNFLSTTNKNERSVSYIDKNLPQDHRISMTQYNDKETFEKISNDVPRDVDPVPVKKEADVWIRCLLAFSPVINGGKIVNTDPATQNSLTCLHGLRVFSLGWVVMVHTYLQVFSIADNKTLRTVTERNFMFQTISNATYSVDTFFFIRLTPAYLFVLGMNEIAINHALSKTVFSPGIIDHLTCKRFWWRNALYINSLFPRTEMCMLWSWYMANDTQFYVIGILLLLLSVKHLKAVTFIVLAIIISSWFTTFSIAYTNDYVARLQEPFALFDELYDKPWLRAGPYFIGTITGYILFKTKCKIYLPSLIVYFGNLAASYLLSFCVSIALEAPVVNLLKIAFTSKKSTR
ncbi:nose resistant to fluoxetine protein 6-like isoform X2 [Belonocnema kinseyi]|uniref:nose resistant to fluoxetine protein 6-like isoform X2 n=1 Tax=Belonocnema kinseyi TaxID=2817044 RepID=UPI00143CD4AE|nr:nose resistant to fluoxetine protein 6-like isoform X2 [Belonocnema kinseyi]